MEIIKNNQNIQSEEVEENKMELSVPKELTIMDLKGFNVQEQAEINKFVEDFFSLNGMQNNQVIQSIGNKSQDENLKYAKALIKDASNTDAEERVRVIMKDFMVQAEIIDEMSTPKESSFMRRVLDKLTGIKDEALKRKKELEERKQSTIDILNGIGQRLEETTLELRAKDTQLNNFAKEKMENIRLLEKYIMACMIIEEQGKENLVKLNADVENSGLYDKLIEREEYLAGLETLSTKIMDLQNSRLLTRTSLYESLMIKRQYRLIEQQLIRTRTHAIPALIDSLGVLIFQINADITREGYKDVNKLVGDITKKTAETVSKGYLEVARDSKQGLVSYEVFSKLSNDLIKAHNDVTKILDEAKQKRLEETKKLEEVEKQIEQNITKLSAVFSEIEKPDEMEINL